jgi:hypothetical protein
VDIIITENEGGDMPEFDDNGAIVKIRHGDGSVTVSLDGKPIDEANLNRKNHKWFGNLAEDLDDGELHRISDDLLRGIEEDERSRTEWLEARANGIKLMGLQVEVPGQQGAADGAPVEGMSKVRHPLLQEAVIRFASVARSELLPTDGPIKIRNDDNNASVQEDQMANALEADANHYLTVTASEYYPDTDRMLIMLGFGGTSFKKGYYCVLRNRPVLESVDAADLIVNNQATDLKNAIRITHRSIVPRNVVRRLQLLGEYRDIDLHQPLQVKMNAVDEQKASQQGIQKGDFARPEDRSHEIYECYCYLDILGYEHKWKGKESGLEIPYRVTIDVSSKKILSIVRNYDEDTKELPEARIPFVKYTYFPGFGFYDIGLLHMLANTTNALTAVWRELLDAGMFACFPGVLIDKLASRQNSNILRVPPGGAVQIDTGGRPMGELVSPLPYKEPSAALMALAQEMATTGMRVGGTAEQMVGEGKQDAQTGAVLAIIEQQTVVKDSVHKRLHAAQCEEFELLFKLFREHPKSFWQANKKPAKPWDEKMFLDALDNYELVPQADPNTSSQTARILKFMGLKTLASQAPQMYNPIAIDTAILTDVLKIANPQQFFAPPQAMGRPTPDQQEKTSEAQQRLSDSKAKLMMAQAHQDLAKAKINQMGLAPENGEQPKTTHEMSMDQMDAQAKLMDAHTRAKAVDQQRGDILLKDAQAQEDRKSKEMLAHLQMARDVMDKRADMQIQQSEHQDAMRMDAHKHATGLQADMQKHASGLDVQREQHAADLDHQASSLKSQEKMHTGDLKAKESLAKTAAKAKAKPSAKPK